MRIIISKKADVCFIQDMERRAREEGRAEKSSVTRRMIVFTDDPLETRRKIDVGMTLRVTARGVSVKLVDPIKSDVVLRRVGARYEADLKIDLDTEKFLDILAEPIAIPSLDEAEESLAASA